MVNQQHIDEYMFIQDKVTQEYSSQAKYLTKFILDNKSFLPTEQLTELINKIHISNEILKKLCTKAEKLDDDIKE